MKQNFKAILVPGYRLNSDGSPAPELTGRVDRALEVYQKYRVPVACLGADAAGAGVSEAAVMKRMLLERGVPENDIITEDRSRITAENFINAAAILGVGARAALVTSDYHVFRARMLARRAGFKVKCFSAHTPWDKVKRHRLILEFLGIIDALCGWQTGKTRPAKVERFKQKVFKKLGDQHSTKP